MAYPSVNAAHSYYSSSKDPRYHSTSAPVNVAPTSSAYAVYPSSQSYGRSIPDQYASSYGGGGHTGNTSAYSTYSSGTYGSNPAATPRTPHPSTQSYYHHTGQAYPTPHLSSSKSYDPRHGPPPSSKSYPASPSRPYQCDQCPLSFDRSHDLKRHIESHSGAKPYGCDSCDRTFTRKDALKRHQSQKQCGVKDA